MIIKNYNSSFNTNKNKSFLNFTIIKIIVRNVGDSNVNKGKQKATPEENELIRIEEEFGTTTEQQIAIEEKIKQDNLVLENFVRDVENGSCRIHPESKSTITESNKIEQHNTIKAVDSQGNTTLSPQETTVDLSTLLTKDSDVTVDELFPLRAEQEQQIARNRLLMQNAARASVAALTRASEFARIETRLREEIQQDVDKLLKELKEAKELHQKNSLLARIQNYMLEHPYQSAAFGVVIACLAYLGFLKPGTNVIINMPSPAPPFFPYTANS